MYTERKEIYKKIEQLRNSRVLTYVTGDRQGLETQIHSEVLDYFSEHLDSFNLPKKITLIIYSRGGNTLAGWNIANLIRLFCDDFEVIIPSKAHSTATLISIGASKIIMTKQATLGPIDPSINTPLNPQVPGGPPNSRLPISVEAVAGFFELAKKELGIKKEEQLTKIFELLSNEVHPIALGNVYRARTQIQMLAEKLLSYHLDNKKIIKNIISILCSESGSHDYTINRREALNQLKLPIEKPNEEFYSIIKSVYNDFRDELELLNPLNAENVLGNELEKDFTFIRGLIESTTGGSYKYITKGKFNRDQSKNIITQIQQEGWTHEYS